MTQTQVDLQSNELLFANFNQDSTSLAVGSRHGYRIFALNSVDILEEIFEDRGCKDICLIERLFSSSLAVVVSLNSPRKLKVCHFHKGTEICYYNYSNTILALRLNRSRLVVVLEESIYIHNTKDMKVLHTIRGTPPNAKGICALSSVADNSLLAYPGSPNTGEVQIYDVAGFKAVTSIHAHNNPIAALAFNKDATIIATASDRGTVIRVFSMSGSEAKKIHEFRRGVRRCVTINSLAFSSDGSFLAASSNTETVHVFKLEHPVSPTQTSNANRSEYISNQMNGGKNESTWMDYINTVWSTSSSYLPLQVSDILKQDRAFATVKLPTICKKTICTLSVIQKLLRVVVASLDGYLYIYNLDTEVGGDCTLIRQHKLFTEPTLLSHSASPLAIPQSTYADAIRGSKILQKQSNGRSGSTGSSVSSSGDSNLSTTPKSNGSPGFQRYSESPKGRLKQPIDENDLADDLPLDDDSEFPPMTMYSD